MNRTAGVAAGAAPVSAACAPALAPPLAAHFAALPPAWRAVAAAYLESPAAGALARFIDGRCAAGARIYPPQPLAALHDCAPDAVRVVILGQDPYHGPGQAHGYAFSVPPGVRVPPSLRNIFQEIARDRADGRAVPGSGCLLHWSRQGVLLLNAALTVEEGAAGSHAGNGWEGFTDVLIGALARLPSPKAFVLWGAHAQAKQGLIASAAAALSAAMQPLVLTANHPSPLSARRPPLPFIGCGHFSRVNQHLSQAGLAPIAW